MSAKPFKKTFLLEIFGISKPKYPKNFKAIFFWRKINVCERLGRDVPNFRVYLEETAWALAA